jgi:hypothetical protein
MAGELVMRKLFLFIAMVGLAATLSAQSLTQLAKTEKARRDALGGRRGPVVTNADLLRVKIRPAVEVVVLEEEAVEGLTEEGAAEEAAEGAAGTAEAEPGIEPAAGSEAASPETPGEATEPGPTPEEKLRDTEDLIDLLETKIAALNQDYSHQTNMVPNYVIEQQLTETLKKLQNAQADAIRLRREIDQKRLEKRTAAAPIR